MPLPQIPRLPPSLCARSDRAAVTPRVEGLALGDASFHGLAEHFAVRPDFALLDSQASHEGWNGFSFFSFAPFARLQAKGERATLSADGTQVTSEDPLGLLQEVLEELRVDRAPDTAWFPFRGGAIGYLAYELGRRIEVLPEQATDDLQLPDCYLCFYSFAVGFEHASGRMFLCHLDAPGSAIGPSRDAICRELHDAAAALGRYRASAVHPRGQLKGIVPDLTEAAYRDAVRRTKEYIFAGDVYQVNMTQRFRAEIGTTSPWRLYTHLSRNNPAPFAAYLKADGHTVVSSSPELFLRLRGTQLETRPIKGTIRRGATPDEDAAQQRALLQSHKNRAELAMIVDLLRNDFGRVCETGTVRVRAFPQLESYASLHHLVATVTGQLEAGRTLVDIVRATFPGGSITGAPKIRAMEIIDELEPVARGVYTGCIGYLTLDGDAELNIAIRTIVVKDGTAYIHAGGGVVADSDEQEEYEESLLKASKLLQAVQFVCEGELAAR